jgi:hypothetical protein
MKHIEYDTATASVHHKVTKDTLARRSASARRHEETQRMITDG